jgi:hypothetical protein
MNAIEAMEGQPPERHRLEISLTPTTAGDALVAVTFFVSLPCSPRRDSAEGAEGPHNA